MEVFQTASHYIFMKGERSLWWNRVTSEFAVKPGWDLANVGDIECIGMTPGIVGVLALPSVYEPHLVIIKESTALGALYPPHMVHKIKSICILSSDEPDATLITCPKHTKSNHSTPTHSVTRPASASRPKLFEGNQLVNKTWGAVKIAGSTIKNTTQQAAAIASHQVKSSVGIRDPTRLEKRLSDELHKIFDETDSFFYSLDCDLTNNLQRQPIDGVQVARDERFFWNAHMIKDIINLNDETWILPIVQGFAQIETCVIGNECLTLALISRRSRHRAGTRYKRRGVDEQGYCANYVETEQILTLRHHQLSFTQVRGSVPIYWSQPGYKYRPPPRLDRGEQETQEAFEQHFAKELAIYNGVCIVNLVEQCGKEKLIGDAFAKHVIKYNNERVIYVTFDFHDYCRGMRFENVSTLVDALAPEAGAMGFHWRDQRGVICTQKSVFRINCMDCLDRTNVVETAFAKVVLESLLVKLGLALPYTPMPDALKTPFMTLWANNGDIISRQYAGTNALKGDYTRTGERKITGLMKDGMNSANRYYLAQFKDSYRQATIDLMLGNQVSPNSLSATGGQAPPEDADGVESTEHARMLVEDCRRLLLGSAQYPVGAWGLIDADPNTGDINETEVDSVLLLTDESYIVAEYDSHLEKIVRFAKVPLVSVTMIELGMYQQTKIFHGSAPALLCLRLSYKISDQDGYFHMFRSANVRFFNSIAFVIKTQEEQAESLMSIIEMFRIALDSVGNAGVRYLTGGMLQRRKSRVPTLEVPKGMPRPVSESQLVQFSSRAISNVAGQFSKLGSSFKKAQAQPSKQQEAAPVDQCVEAEKAVFYVGHKQKKRARNSDSSSEDESSTFEPEYERAADAELPSMVNAAEIPVYNENTFLPSVGIVMAQNSKDDGAVQAVGATANDVAAMSICSVLDNVKPPTGLLENAPAGRPITPTPLINIENAPAAAESAQSRSESPNDANEQSRLRQLRNPLSKLTKGIQNVGLNLNARSRTTTKTGGGSSNSPGSSSADSTPPERASSRQKEIIQQLWAEQSCKSKLIAL